MQKRYNKVLVLVFCAGFLFPLWSGAEERPATETGQATVTEQSVPAPEQQADQTKHAAEKQPEAAAAKEERFQRVELDPFIEQEQHATGKGKMIKMARPVSFDARLKRQPEEREMKYIYVALELSGVKPMPEVQHRMFIESGGGRIIPVYVEKNAVAKINAGLKEDEKARFLGYHVYSYAKGPALLVVDFASAP